MHQPITGLTEKEAKAKLLALGPNEIPSGKSRSFLWTIVNTLKEPMLLMLFACAIIYFPLGNISDAISLLAASLFIIIISIYQERKTENALEALRQLASPEAIVIRDGKEKKVAFRELVADDIIVLREGCRVPADAMVIQTSHLMTDESLLTGESVPVNKSEWNGIDKPGEPGGENQPAVYSGTMVTGGYAIAKVFATGLDSELGKIGKSLESIEQEKSLLNKEVRHLIKIVGTYAAIICVLVFFLYGIFYTQWVKGLLAGLSLAMAMLPEEFPVVLTIFLSLGAWRIARKNVLTRKITAIETLGATTTLCVDKTGTLTQNKMQVESLYCEDETLITDHKPLPEKYHELVEYAILASQKNPFDPMDKAILEFGNLKLHGTEHIHHNWELVREYPLSTKLISMSEVWKSRFSDHYTIAAKGSPEAIFNLCHLSEKQINIYLKSLNEMAENGLRVLGVAKAIHTLSELESDQHDYQFYFAGLIGFGDPIRLAVPDAIRVCKQAGIKVKMITGDYPATAINIAKQIGLYENDSVVSGADLSVLSGNELLAKTGSCTVFSRVTPSQKLDIVNILKKNNEIVAMTGDGVNDAPALKAAHIGIAMGQKGTDVAREAASIILLDDDFSSIVDAIAMGRRIFHNLQKAMSYIIAVHIPIAGMALLPLFFSGMPVILYPIHIVLMELIIDPASTILFEAENDEENSMKKPPRTINTPILNQKRLRIDALQGLSVLAMLIAVYFICNYLRYSDKDIRTITFISMLIGNLSLILTNLSDVPILKRKWSENSVLPILFGIVILLILAILYLPFLRETFHFSILHFNDILICLFTGVTGILWFEILKSFRIKNRLIAS